MKIQSRPPQPEVSMTAAEIKSLLVDLTMFEPAAHAVPLAYGYLSALRKLGAIIDFMIDSRLGMMAIDIMTSDTDTQITIYY